MSGDAVVVMMADESDDCRDEVRCWKLLNQGWDAVFGSRFVKGGGVIDYPWLKRRLNRIANFLIRLIFGVKLNDTTNAFKAYRATVFEGCRRLLSPHFNLIVELPLKTIVRGYSRTVMPITRRNRRTGIRSSPSKRWEVGTFSLLACPAGAVLQPWRLQKAITRSGGRSQGKLTAASRVIRELTEKDE
jgi:hypothetical protein